jgi:hypothetical protein
MTEANHRPPGSISAEAEHFGSRVDRLLDSGLADTFHGALETLIANELVPPIPQSQHKAYIDDRPELVRSLASQNGSLAERRACVIAKDRRDQLMVGAYGSSLNRSYADSLPSANNEAHITYTETVKSMRDTLDSGLPVSICGFQRQGKTSLAFSVAQARQQRLVHIDAQSALLNHIQGIPPMVVGMEGIYDKDGIHQRRRRHPSLSANVWAELNEEAVINNERILVCFDELTTFTQERHRNKIDSLKREMIDITSFSNLDFIAIEHVGEGLATGERIDILPPDTRRFYPPLATKTQTQLFLDKLTTPNREYFTGNAVHRIHELSGGRLSLSAAIGASAIRKAWELSGVPRFIFDENDLQRWEKAYYRFTDARESGGDPKNKHITSGLIATIDNMDKEGRDQLRKLAECDVDGIAVDTVPVHQLQRLLKYGLARYDQPTNRIHMRIGLMVPLIDFINRDRGTFYNLTRRS